MSKLTRIHMLPSNPLSLSKNERERIADMAVRTHEAEAEAARLRAALEYEKAAADEFSDSHESFRVHAMRKVGEALQSAPPAQEDS